MCILLFSCLITPVQIALYETLGTGWSITNYTIDVLFFIDIILIFNSSYYDNQLELIEDRWVIAQNYLRGWFAIDMIAIIPFEIVM